MTKQEEADARLGFAALARGGLIPPPPPGSPYDVIETDRPGWSNIVGLTRYLVGQASDPPDRRELRPPAVADGRLRLLVDTVEAAAAGLGADRARCRRRGRDPRGRCPQRAGRSAGGGSSPATAAVSRIASIRGRGSTSP